MYFRTRMTATGSWRLNTMLTLGGISRCYSLYVTDLS